MTKPDQQPAGQFTQARASGDRREHNRRKHRFPSATVGLEPERKEHMMSTPAWDALPPWMQPPRPSGWEADDLDQVPDLPRHTELIDGALIFMMSPQRSWHSRVVENLTVTLRQQAPEGFDVDR